MPDNPEGVLLIDKPTGCTSHDVVDRVRRKLNIRKVGHAGTLDPLATGLLIILVGKATKVSQYLMSLSKEYEGTMKLGESTDSHDSDGIITETRSADSITEADIKDTMEDFIGDQYQTPPMFSAKKHKGKPLYKIAREGKEVEREPRFIHVSKYDLLSFTHPSAVFRVACSKGTYIRTLAHDLGEKLDCGAHLTQLRRTKIDRFDISEASTLEAFEASSASQINRLLIPVYQVVPSNVL